MLNAEVPSGGPLARPALTKPRRATYWSPERTLAGGIPMTLSAQATQLVAKLVMAPIRLVLSLVGLTKGRAPRTYRD